MNARTHRVSSDQPLRIGSAASNDKLGRRDFAGALASTLDSVDGEHGLVVSIEGVWGSGKSSTLALVEEALRERKPVPPVILHFNPWLIGDRDALLRQFLTRLAGAIQIADHAKNALSVAKEIRAYSTVFDVLKLIPGAEPWASLVKLAMTSVGDASESVGRHKTPDLDAQKQRVVDALATFDRQVVVIVDDVDRLYPSEVIEMIRIIKAVGEFPNVGYLLAWDPRYVSGALMQLGIPHSDSYLDKVVQVRMPLPAVSSAARRALFEDALNQLQPEARTPYFKSSPERMAKLYYSGLRDLVEQPRDFIRVFNHLRLIEPTLRGEVALPEIVGLSVLAVLADPVFQLLQRSPQYFVGHNGRDSPLFDKPIEVVKQGSEERSSAILKCRRPGPVRQLVHTLFPLTEYDEVVGGPDRIDLEQGSLATPDRLRLALQLGPSIEEVSLVAVRRFIRHAEGRGEIAARLSGENLVDFIDALDEVLEAGEGVDEKATEDLAVAIASLVDSAAAAQHVRERRGFFSTTPVYPAVRALDRLLKSADTALIRTVAERLIGAPDTVSVGAYVLLRSFVVKKENEPGALRLCEETCKDRYYQQFADALIARAKAGNIAECGGGRQLLEIFVEVVPEGCPQLFNIFELRRSDLDWFVFNYLADAFDSVKGQRYCLPKELDKLERFASLERLKALAAERLADPEPPSYPVRAAWECIVCMRSVYGVDGTFASD